MGQESSRPTGKAVGPYARVSDELRAILKKIDGARAKDPVVSAAETLRRANPAVEYETSDLAAHKKKGVFQTLFSTMDLKPLSARPISTGDLGAKEARPDPDAGIFERALYTIKSFTADLITGDLFDAGDVSLQEEVPSPDLPSAAPVSDLPPDVDPSVTAPVLDLPVETPHSPPKTAAAPVPADQALFGSLDLEDAGAKPIGSDDIERPAEEAAPPKKKRSVAARSLTPLPKRPGRGLFDSVDLDSGGDRPLETQDFREEDE